MDSPTEAEKAAAYAATKIELPLTDDGEIDWMKARILVASEVEMAKFGAGDPVGILKAIAAHERGQCAKVAEKDWSAFSFASPRYMRRTAQAIRKRRPL